MKRLFPVHLSLLVLTLVLSIFLSGCNNNELSISSLPDDSQETIENEETDIQDSMSFSDASGSLNDNKNNGKNNANQTNDLTVKSKKGSMCVYLCGAVKNIGVYYFDDGQQLFEIVEEAGGLDEDADTDSINMAAVLQDGEKIRIPYIGENITTEEDSLININTAGVDELCTIPGIGPARANAIIAYREEIGGRFENIEQLKEVSGIKDGSFNKIKPYICAK